MTRMSSRLVTCVAALLIAAASASAQSRRVDSGSAALQRFVFFWETQLNPPTPPLADGSFFAVYEDVAPDEVHRMMMDRVKRVYFGYSVRIELQPGNSYRLTFQPLSLTPRLTANLGDNPAAWKALPAPKFPAAQTIHAGEVLELNLLSNSSWGQRLTEYVTVQEPSRAEGFQLLNRSTREFSFAPGPPRDFTVSDAALRLKDPRVFIDGQFEETSGRTMGEESGAAVWIYIPKRGRFLLSVLPSAQQGFRRAGEIRGNSLSFAVGGSTYSVTSGTRIAPGPGAYNLYVLHQPDWRPTYANADVDIVTIGAADRVEYLVGSNR